MAASLTAALRYLSKKNLVPVTNPKYSFDFSDIVIVALMILLINHAAALILKHQTL